MCCVFLMHVSGVRIYQRRRQAEYLCVMYERETDSVRCQNECICVCAFSLSVMHKVSNKIGRYDLCLSSCECVCVLYEMHTLRNVGSIIHQTIGCCDVHAYCECNIC